MEEKPAALSPQAKLKGKHCRNEEESHNIRHDDEPGLQQDTIHKPEKEPGRERQQHRQRHIIGRFGGSCPLELRSNVIVVSAPAVNQISVTRSINFLVSAALKPASTVEPGMTLVSVSQAMVALICLGMNRFTRKECYRGVYV